MSAKWHNGLFLVILTALIGLFVSLMYFLSDIHTSNQLFNNKFDSTIQVEKDLKATTKDLKETTNKLKESIITRDELRERRSLEIREYDLKIKLLQIQIDEIEEDVEEIKKRRK